MSTSTDWIELSRDCEAIMIPAGHTVLLPKGTRAVITQSLGGSFTLHVPEYGGLMRVSNRDADAVGQEVPPEAAAEPASSGEPVPAEQLEAMIWDQLRSCYDPEIPVNIVDLGLVYDMRLSPIDDGRHRVDVKMTLTAQGCGMGASIAADAKYKILGLPGVAEADVEIVWSPVWNPNMISPEGRAKLGME
ncbi:MAG TPA: iron-sulfur cluster assembly protein [Candidatus Binatia bacterium]|nr:iron-sulfur cluster assembly protein [Candidatus Binatia bacterium]